MEFDVIFPEEVNVDKGVLPIKGIWQLWRKPTAIKDVYADTKSLKFWHLHRTEMEFNRGHLGRHGNVASKRGGITIYSEFPSFLALP
jgi:hypothetical protein